MKDAYILYKIKDIQAKIKEAQNKGDMEQIFDLMKQNAHLNEIKNVLCKELGERWFTGALRGGQDNLDPDHQPDYGTG